LEAISKHEPASIREAAELVDRDYKQVHRNLSEFADIDVIEFQGGGPGEIKTPMLVYDSLEIDSPSTGSNGNTGTVAL
jgi:predicted transcriptional regulator